MPAAWKDISASKAGTTISLMYVEQNNNASIWGEKADTKVQDLKKFAKAFDKLAEKQYPFIDEQEDSDKVTVDGHKARLQEYEGKIDGNKVITLMLIVPTEKKLFLITGLYPEKMKKTLGKTVRETMLQLKVKK